MNFKMSTLIGFIGEAKQVLKLILETVKLEKYLVQIICYAGLGFRRDQCCGQGGGN